VEAAEHEEAHELLTHSMPEKAVDEWTKMVEAWERDNRTKNPFMVEIKSECGLRHSTDSLAKCDTYLALTQAAVRGKLADEDHAEIVRGEAIVVDEDVSPSVFINSGLELEDLQYVLYASSFQKSELIK
jgi:hypothetical protein